MDRTNKTNTGTVSKDANRDPLTGEPGAHPVGVGIGTAAGGAAAGTAIGMVAGPIGAAIGAIAGGVAGGLAGKDMAEAIDPTAEDAYWRKECKNRPYFTKDSTYEEFQPAYRYGSEAALKQEGRPFDLSESDLQTDWNVARGPSKLDWNKARPAAKDAYERVCLLRHGARRK